MCYSSLNNANKAYGKHYFLGYFGVEAARREGLRRGWVLGKRAAIPLLTS